MTSTNNTPNNITISIQLKLFDSNDYEKNLKEKTYLVKNYQNQDKRVKIVDTDKYEYINPLYPYCNSNNHIKQGNRSKTLNFLYKYKHKNFVKKYKCKSCRKYFQTELESIVERNKNYSTHFIDCNRKFIKNELCIS